MNTPRANPKALMEVLTPELMKLCKGAPAFGELTLRVILADGMVGRVCLGVEISRKIEPWKDHSFDSGPSIGRGTADHSNGKESDHE
jgi:hypothetical protein